MGNSEREEDRREKVSEGAPASSQQQQQLLLNGLSGTLRARPPSFGLNADVEVSRKIFIISFSDWRLAVFYDSARRFFFIIIVAISIALRLNSAFCPSIKYHGNYTACAQQCSRPKFL